MKRYACIGGPLDGKRLTSAELLEPLLSRGPTKWAPNQPPAGTLLREGGMYGDYGAEYSDYNRSTGTGPTMVRLHKSLLEV